MIREKRRKREEALVGNGKAKKKEGKGKGEKLGKG